MKTRFVLCLLAFSLLGCPLAICNERDDVVEVLDCYISEKYPTDNRNYLVTWRDSKGIIKSSWMTKAQYNNLLKRAAYTQKKLAEKRRAAKKKKK